MRSTAVAVVAAGVTQQAGTLYSLQSLAALRLVSLLVVQPGAQGTQARCFFIPGEKVSAALQHSRGTKQHRGGQSLGRNIHREGPHSACTHRLVPPRWIQNQSSKQLESFTALLFLTCT